MDLIQARQRFICEWGTLCTNWGVNKTMGHIHALLLVTKGHLCADEVMEKLKISRGNVNMNLHALMDWGLVHKVNITGDRKDYYRAEKDLNKVFKSIVDRRKKKELDPLMDLLGEVGSIQPRCPSSSEFCNVVRDLRKFTNKVDHALAAITSSKSDWIAKFLVR